MTQPLRIGIVGCGFSREHVRVYKSLPSMFRVEALCDMNLDKARTAAAEAGVNHACASLDELLEMKQVDVVDICTPSYLHFPMAKRALEAGKHVVVEKPAASSLKEIDELLRLEKRYTRRVMPVFQYRFGNGLQKLKYLQRRGLTGRAHISTVEMHWRRRDVYYNGTWHGKWATELGGPLVSLAIHTHDMLTYILGPVRSAQARTRTLVNPIETEDTAAAVLEMADGSLATLSVTTGSPQQISRHRFCFSRLSAESHTAPYTNSSEPWQFIGDNDEIQAEMDAALSAYTPVKEGLAGQMEQYGLAMQVLPAGGDPGGVDLPVTLSDARQAIELVTALYASASLGRTVELPLLEDHPFYSGWFSAQSPK